MDKVGTVVGCRKGLIAGTPDKKEKSQNDKGRCDEAEERGENSDSKMAQEERQHAVIKDRQEQYRVIASGPAAQMTKPMRKKTRDAGDSRQLTREGLAKE
jgi:hypothetical protein